ncbi:hypothetical protein P8452_57008 [Trifolium repens]|jgi:hypothetical protein|nr:hypothetical protein P8452_56996 [Trifolium repens]WJX73188.1 hypothetical protein P8452_56998 [Trifolium repens]WJX73190.1 hypothetical protein P8452_57000 [Trifolium repens]WJX73192.1 hypothetical protein P8452_57002 [Trifolium repens]WJX73194.1 hypothetical protein P8452_57004 [Trifolium repens]
MSRLGPLTRSKAIARTERGEPSNLHDVKIFAEPINTQQSHQVPQLANQTFVPIDDIFSFIHASLGPNTNHHTPPPNTQAQNTAETNVPNPPRQPSQE